MPWAARRPQSPRNCWRLWDAEQELGVDKHTLEHRLDPGVKVPTGPARFEELDELVHVALRHRPAERAARQRRDDLPRAVVLVRTC